MIPFTAYIEGWALYTEQLAAEQGFYKSWFSYLGYLDFQLLRSCRYEYLLDFYVRNSRFCSKTCC
jgi:uncharacterized protein (DUF885 family)